MGGTKSQPGSEINALQDARHIHILVAAGQTLRTSLLPSVSILRISLWNSNQDAGLSSSEGVRCSRLRFHSWPLRNLLMCFLSCEITSAKAARMLP